MKWLKNLDLNDRFLNFTLQNLADCVVQLRQRKAQTLKELRIMIQESKKEKEYNKLTNIKGIGIVGAATILTEIVDIKRFRSYESFHSFIGSYPAQLTLQTLKK